MGSWVTHTEEETQEWWHKNLERFGYSPTQAYPKNNEKQTRRVKRDTAIEGTIIWDIFGDSDIIVKTYMDDGLPIVSKTFGFKGNVVFWMGSLKMSYILKHGPDKKGGFTTEENITRRGKYKDEDYFTEVNRLLESPQEQSSTEKVPTQIAWTKNPHTGQPWPQGFFNYEAEEWEKEEWLKQHHALQYEYVTSMIPTQEAKDLEQIKMSPEKMEFYNHIKKLEDKEFGGGPQGVYDTLADISINDYNDKWNIVLPANRAITVPVLMNKEFIELDEGEMNNYLTLPDSKVPAYVKEVLNLLQEGDKPSSNYLIRPPKGIPVNKAFTILRRKEEDWRVILKATIPVFEILKNSLIKLQTTYPNVFLKKIDITDLEGSIDNMIVELDAARYKRNDLDLDKIKVQLEEMKGNMTDETAWGKLQVLR